MAKKSVVHRNIKRQQLAAKYREMRLKLKEAVKNLSLSDEVRLEAQKKLQELPRDASPTRVRRRCSLTGRPRGVYRKFKLSRIKLRECASRGDLPGLVKASW